MTAWLGRFLSAWLRQMLWLAVLVAAFLLLGLAYKAWDPAWRAMAWGDFGAMIWEGLGPAAVVIVPLGAVEALAEMLWPEPAQPRPRARAFLRGWAQAYAQGAAGVAVVALLFFASGGDGEAMEMVQDPAAAARGWSLVLFALLALIPLAASRPWLDRLDRRLTPRT